MVKETDSSPQEGANAEAKWVDIPWPLWREASYVNAKGETVIIKREEFVRTIRTFDPESGRYIDTFELNDGREIDEAVTGGQSEPSNS